MGHEFYSRVNRYYLEGNYEFWGVQFDYDGDGYVSEDIVAIRWEGRIPKVLVLINNPGRVDSEEYYSVILCLFESLTDGEGSFEVKRVYDKNVDEYSVDEIKQKLTEYFV